MFGLGSTEIIVVLVIGLVLFGKNLPSIARNLGKSVTDFRKELGGLSDDVNPNR